MSSPPEGRSAEMVRATRRQPKGLMGRERTRGPRQRSRWRTGREGRGKAWRDLREDKSAEAGEADGVRVRSLHISIPVTR